MVMSVQAEGRPSGQLGGKASECHATDKQLSKRARARAKLHELVLDVLDDIHDGKCRGIH